jgi:hypothetical protein
MIFYVFINAHSSRFILGVSKKTEKPIKPRKPKKITEKTEP